MKRVRISKLNLKLFSLLSGFFIWVYVLHSERLEVDKNIGLEFVTPDDMVLSEKIPQEVMFTIEGPRAFVLSVMSKEENLIINLEKMLRSKSQKNILKLDASLLKLPLGVKVKKIRPNKIPIVLEKKMLKILPLKPHFFSYKKDQNIDVFNVQFDPAELKVSGPKSLMTKLEEVFIKPIEIESLLGTKEVPVELNLIDSRLKIETDKSFKMSFELKIKKPNLVLNNLPIRVFSKNSKIQTKMKNANIKLFIPESLKKTPQFSSRIQVWVDVPGGAKGEMKLPLKAFIPPGAELLEITPKSILVDVQ